MRDLSAALLTELGLTLTRPGYLVRIALSTPLYLSTIGDVSWDGETWTGVDLKVTGLTSDASGSQRGQLSLGNADLGYGALVLNQTINDVAVDVYAVWAGQVDPILEFSGVADGCAVGLRVTIDLAASSSRSQSMPRRFINASTGFNTLLPAGSKVTVGTQTYIVERD